MKLKTKYKIGQKVILTSINTSYNVGVSDIIKKLPATVIIKRIDNRGGRATNNDPRYYGDGWNCRECGLKPLTNDYPIY